MTPFARPLSRGPFRAAPFPRPRAGNAVRELQGEIDVVFPSRRGQSFSAAPDSQSAHGESGAALKLCPGVRAFHATSPCTGVGKCGAVAAEFNRRVPNNRNIYLLSSSGDTAHFLV
jgi:hypothetical protein